jgi:copper transport protein
MRTTSSAARAALLAFLLTLLAPAAALAHAVLVASEPSDGTMFATPPERLTLTFNEPVSPLVVRLLAPVGEQEIVIRQDGAALAIHPVTTLRNGTHALNWRVVSADGHPVSGTVIFSVGHASEAGSPPRASNAALRSAAWAARVVIYIALFFAAGGAFFVAWFGESPFYAVERILHAALIAGLVAVPLSVGLHGADLLGVSLTQLDNPAVWRAGILSTHAATAALAFLAIFAAQLSFSASSRRNARVLSAVGLACVGAALAASGHASAASPQWLMRPAVFIHALGIAFWTGALLPLAGLLLARPRDAAATLRRFSRAVPYAVVLLIASGVVLAAVQVEVRSALSSTDYGRLLLVKLALLVILFSLALYNRFSLTGRVEAGEAAAARTLIRSIAAEVALALLIFAIAAAWRFTPPPRALASLAAAPVAVHIHTERAMADVRFDPGRMGMTAVSIVLMSGDFGPLDAKEVQLVLSHENAGIEAIRRPVEMGADGIWRLQAVPVPVPGRWNVRLDVLIGDFEKILLEEAVDFRP